MADIELKAPRRQVRRDSENFIPILLVVITVISGGIFSGKREVKRQEAAEQKEAETAVKAEEPAQSNDARVRQRVQKNIDERQSQPVVTTESGRIYYAPQTGAPAYEADELSTADHYRIAIQIMQQSRQVQKQIEELDQLADQLALG